MNNEPVEQEWYQVADVDSLPSPGLLIYRERVEENLRRMLTIAGGAERLRPHIKTHKMREVIELQLAQGVSKFKCATIAEAELAGSAGVPDLLLAYQPVGPNRRRVVELMRAFPRTKFSVVCDDALAIQELAATLERAGGQKLDVLLDIDVGQHRTGVLPGAQAVELYRLVVSSGGLAPGGLHAYDGHISDPDVAARTAACEAAFAPVAALRRELLNAGLPVPRVVAGGSPTFAIHARRGDVECSPGTCVFWDATYQQKLPDLSFLPAAVVLTRLVAKPGGNRLCLDLGHKAIAAEMPHPRVEFLNLPDATAVMHNEEHLVVETPRADACKVGDCLYGVPWHICPTVALHETAELIVGGRHAGAWKVAARSRKLTI